MENKINIAKKIIEQSPPSEIKDIFEGKSAYRWLYLCLYSSYMTIDLKGLVDIPNLDELLQDSFKSYNENQFNNVLINNNKDNVRFLFYIRCLHPKWRCTIVPSFTI